MNKNNLLPEEQRQIVADLERKEVLLKTINEFALKLLTIRTKDDLVWYVAREVVAQLGFDDCVIYLLDPEKNLLRQVATIGAKNPHGNEIVNPLEIPVGKGITGYVAQTGESLIVDDLSQDSRYISDVEPALSEICVPLIIDNAVAGIIDCEDPRPRHFGQEHLETLTTIAAMTSAKLKILNEMRLAKDRADELHRVNDQLLEENVERKRAEEKLRDSEVRLASALEQAKLGYWASNFADSKITHWSDQSANILGIEHEDLPNCSESYLKFIYAEDLERVAKCYEDRNAKLPEPVPYQIEYRFRRPDGEVIWLYEDAKILTDPSGEPVGYNGTIQDITEMKRAETLLAHAMDVSPAVFALYDADDRLVKCNRQYQDMYETEAVPMTPGVTFEKLVRAFAAKVGIGKSREDTEEWVARRLDRRSAPAKSLEYQRNDGEWIEVSDHVLEDGSIFTVGSIVTERKQIEADLRQAQKMEALGQLTGGVAHDFNNLLGIIMGNAEILGESTETEDPRLQAILRAAMRGAELTQRLLAFSRQQPLHPQAIDLAELTASTSKLLKRTLGETIEIATTAESDLWPALADPGQVENALLNLAINARDAMPEGGQLTIACMNTHLDEAYVSRNPEAMVGDHVVLAVSDTGTGMSADVLARTFEPFFTTKEVGQGSGLGLSMVYGFAKQSGGHVSIASEEAQGTTVRIYLPRADRPLEKRLVTATKEIPHGQGEVVLIVEDDEDVRIMAVEMLESLGYHVIAVPEAASALSVLERGQKVDLILSDIVLPGGMNGPAFAEQACTIYPNLKVAFMSGYPTEAAKRSNFLGSGKILLNKPFKKRTLARALRDALD